jgi:hypothetical protein
LTGQHLLKASNADYDYAWGTPSGGGITMPLTQDLTFSPDGDWNIGTSSDLRPYQVYVYSNIRVGDTGQLNVLPDTIAAAYDLTIRAGSGQPLRLGAGGNNRWTIDSAGNFTAVSDNAYDIGLSGATRPRTLYIGTSVNTPMVVSPSILALAGTSGLNFQAAGTNRWSLSTAGHLTTFVDNVYDIGASGANRPRSIYAGTSFIGPGAVPTGGTAGQVLSKVDATNYNLTWATPFSQTTADARYLLLTGGTLTGNLLFSTDNTLDIGASGATRPRNIYAGSSVFSNVFTASSGDITVGPTAGSTQLRLRTVGTNRWIIDASGNFITGADNSYDIGASGATRPRDLFLGRSLSVASTSTFMSGIGLGLAGSSSVGFNFQMALSGGVNQWGVYDAPVFGTDCTSQGAVLEIHPNTAVGTHTLSNLLGVNIGAPGLGAGTTVTNAYGLYVANMGVSGVGQARGVYVAAQSGAATSNVGIWNDGTSQLVGPVNVGDGNIGTLDISRGSTTSGVNVAVGGVAILWPGNSFSGMLLISDTIAVGGVAMYLSGGAVLVLVNQSAPLAYYSATKDTPSKINVYLDGSYNIVAQNLLSNPIRIMAFFVRTRGSQ